MPPSIPSTLLAPSRKHLECEAANGASILFTEEGRERKTVVQRCDVSQGLLSVSKVVKAGNGSVFNDAWSYIENTQSVEKTLIEEKGGMFTVRDCVGRSV